MKIYWPLRSIPELEPLPEAQRRAVWRAGARKAMRHWQYWATCLLPGLLTMPIILWMNHPAWDWVWDYGRGPWWYHFLISSVFVGLALIPSSLLCSQILTNIVRPYLPATIERMGLDRGGVQ